jgi:redox-sensing transcriptional repressor
VPSPAGVTDLRKSTHAIPDATVARLPIYHRVLTSLLESGVESVSSHELAEVCGVNSAKLRKDLSHLGSYGTRGVGYRVEYLLFQIAREIGYAQDWPVVIVGVGNLGNALAGYAGSADRGFRIVGLIDSDPDLVGQTIAGVKVRDLVELETVIAEHSASIGVIATPASAAQAVCDRLVASGVTSILNFAPSVLTVPQGVDVRKVDLGTELQILAFHQQQRAEGLRTRKTSKRTSPSPALENIS